MVRFPGRRPTLRRTPVAVAIAALAASLVVGASASGADLSGDTPTASPDAPVVEAPETVAPDAGFAPTVEAAAIPDLAVAAVEGPPILALVGDQFNYEPGGVVEFEGSGWPGGETVTIALTSADTKERLLISTGTGERLDRAEIAARSDGTFAVRIVLPPDFHTRVTAEASGPSGSAGTEFAALEGSF